MKISHNWLNKIIDFKYSPEEVSEMLTAIGLEVEGFEQVESIKGGLEGIVIGLVLSCEKHADADKLSVTIVDIGDGNPQQIVCGAPNVATGQKVLVATVGATLYPIGSIEPLKIKKAKIRGVESNGMICAADELGLGSDHSGILVLPNDTKIGTKAAEYFQVTSDIIYEIGLTPNRSDATCHFGVAKDLYAYIKINKDNSIIINEPNAIGFNVETDTLEIKVNLNKPQLCPRYAGLTISNIEIKESPAWLKNQLQVLGIKSINNIVDVTNYILHELGQPLHAFDADKISNHTINIDTLPKGYKFEALDGRVIELSGEELMICDGEHHGMCIGGVYGGKNSGVTSETKNIFLESAHFTASSIRKTSMGHILRTDAAKVFEKGSDPNICLLALKRAASLIVKIAGGYVSSEVLDIYPKPIKPIEIHLKYHTVRKIIGTSISAEEINDILNALGMEVVPVDENSIKVKVPTNKADVVREIDVIEEILRIYGFNKVAFPQKLNSTLSYAPNPDKLKIVNQMAQFLAANAFNEMMGISLIDSKLCMDAGFENKDLVFINNTSNVGLDVMRPSMLLSGLQACVFNINRQQNNLKLYEIGKKYRTKGNDYLEQEQLSIFISGDEKVAHWSNPKAVPSNYYSIKDITTALVNKFSTKKPQEIELEDENGLAYGISFKIGNEVIAHCGEVAPKLLKQMGIKQKVFYGEINIATLINTHIDSKMLVSEISKFPSVSRDLAIIIDKSVSYNQINASIQAAKIKNLIEVNCFDIYTNEEAIGQGKKSYALNFTFENLSKTLVEKDIEDSMKKIMDTCESELGASVRKG